MRGPYAYRSASRDVVDDVSVQDFAFADTVVAGDLDEAIPPSGIMISNPAGHAQCLMTPLAYGPPAPPPGIATRVQLAWARLRDGLKTSRAEMNALWSATACLEHVHDGQGAIVHEEDPLARAATVGRRVRTFFSFFEWDRADLLRAAWIGLVVFVIAATAGAFALESSSTEAMHPTNGTTSGPMNGVTAR
ncbi:MAG: hypothetical protein BGO98_39095 [Myxococcales bacterium 68-20]|nr:hypothetical protein [Myxococcales bacterium]OJY26365.1 MAG: hypothetical protein BGO98_39095 [Myxococcales bacterium 68-20]